MDHYEALAVLLRFFLGKIERRKHSGNIFVYFVHFIDSILIPSPYINLICVEGLLSFDRNRNQKSLRQHVRLIQHQVLIVVCTSSGVGKKIANADASS